MTASIQAWIQHPELLNRDTLYELRTLLARYPYFQTARLLYLKNLYILHDTTFGSELRKAAIFVSERRSLFYLIEGERFAIHPQKGQAVIEEEPTLDRTLHLINTFLAKIPEEKLLPASDSDLSTDYITYMLREEELPEQTGNESATPLRGQNLIDEFIEKADNGYPFHLSPEEDELQTSPVYAPKEAEEEEDDEYFTETLAKIYIKQQRYFKGMEII